MVEQRTQILTIFKRKSTVPMRISTVLSVFAKLYVLFGVQFDDKCFVNFDRKFFTLRKTSECSFEAFQVFFNVGSSKERSSWKLVLNISLSRELHEVQ